MKTKLLTITLLFLFCSVCWAEDIDINKLVDAIGRAENSKSHPYGILAHYKHTTPRQACINTIKSALRRWNGKSDFIHFLSLTYCPINCNNDNGTNKFWERNVKFYYKRG